MDESGTPIDTPTASMREGLRRRQSSRYAKKRPADFSALVVDDDATIRDAVAMILESFGYVVSKAEDGIAAMTRLAVGQYDLVITDFDMPFMNGYRLSTWLKREMPRTIVVIMTASCHAEIQQFMATGVVDKWLFKPFGRETLCEALSKLELPTFPCYS